MSWFDKTFKREWERAGKIDPAFHYGIQRPLEVTVHQDNHNIAALDNAISNLFGGDGSTILGDEARKGEHDPARSIGRAAATVGLLFGGAAALGGGGEAGAAGAGGAGAAGYAPATNSVLADSAMGSPGYGASSSGAGSGAYAGAGGFDWQNLVKNQLSQQRQQRGGNQQSDRLKQMLMMAQMLQQQQEQQRAIQEQLQWQKDPMGQAS